jgi:hypothetical protein
MPRTWSRLHEYLGAPPGPVTFEMVRQSVDDKLGEADGLDWKESLPDGRNPGREAGFAKDVAAMANTRGGLIIYGVTDQVEFRGSTRLPSTSSSMPSGCATSCSLTCPGWRRTSYRPATVEKIRPTLTG